MKPNEAAKAAMTEPKHTDDEFPGDMSQPELNVRASIAGFANTQDYVKQEREHRARVKQARINAAKSTSPTLISPGITAVRSDLLPEPQRI